MKYLAFVAMVIFCIAQQPPETPKGKRAAKSNSSQVADKANTSKQEDEQTQKSSTTSGKIAVASQNQTEAASHNNHASSTNQDAHSEELKVQQELALFTGALVVVGLLQVIALVGQAVVFYYTLVQIGRQAKIMERHSGHLKNLAEAASNNATAAKASADALIASQQAQLAVAPDNPMSDINQGNPPKIRIGFTNKGLTPARRCIVETWIEILPEPFEDFTPRAVYHKLPAPMTIYSNAPNPSVFEVWLNRAVTPTELVGLQSGHQLLCLRIRAEYKDAFGHMRWQEFAFAVRSVGLEYLPKYNDSGQGPDTT